MSILSIYGIGSDRVLAKNHCTKGTVTKVSRSWVKVNKKPARLTAGDGAVFSHYITFTYTVENFPYQGTLYVDMGFRCPQKGEIIDIYYDPQKPRRYACYAFGPSVTL